MKAKRARVQLNPIKHISYKMVWTCPKCKRNFEQYGFYQEGMTRFLCECGQEIIADYVKMR